MLVLYRVFSRHLFAPDALTRTSLLEIMLLERRSLLIRILLVDWLLWIIIIRILLIWITLRRLVWMLLTVLRLFRILVKLLDVLWRLLCHGLRVLAHSLRWA